MSTANLNSVHNTLVGSHVESHDFVCAMEEIEQVIAEIKNTDGSFSAAQDHTLSYHLNTRGFLNIQLGHYENALNDCLEARQLNPDLDQNNLNLAHLFFYHYQQTIVPNIEKIKAGFDDVALSEIAKAYHNTGFFAEAASYLNLAIAEADECRAGALYNDLAGAYLGAGMPIEAFQASSKAMILDANLDKQNYNFAKTQVEGLNLDPAQFFQTTVISAQDTNEDNEFFAREYDQALKKYENLVNESSDPEGDAYKDLPSHLQRKAMCHLNLGNFSEASKDCLKARQLDLTLGHMDLRLCQFFEKEYQTKLKPLFKQLEQEISAEVYNDIGLVFYQHKFYAQAATYFNLAISLVEGLLLAESYNNLAGAYFESGFIIEALQATQKAVEINPEINKVNFNLVRTKVKPMMLDAEKLSFDRFEQLQAKS